MSYSYQETLNGESLSRYKPKLNVINCQDTHFTIRCLGKKYVQVA